MNENQKITSDAIEIIHRRFYEGKPDRIAALEEERVNLDIACKIYELRQQAGLTQQELAQLAGTTASVINRLEDADYEGHSLSMLKSIASALNKDVRIEKIPAAAPKTVESRHAH